MNTAFDAWLNLNGTFWLLRDLGLDATKDRYMLYRLYVDIIKYGRQE